MAGIVFKTFTKLITPPARRARWSCKFGDSVFFPFFSVSKVGLPLMGDTAGDAV